MCQYKLVVWQISFLPFSAYLMIKKQISIIWECGMDTNGFDTSLGLDLYEEALLVY